MNDAPESQDNLITPEVIERLKSRDDRIAAIDLMLQLQNELDNSVALKLVLDKAAEEAANALEELADADPTDYLIIRRLQAKVYRARFIAKTINKAILKGHNAEQSLGDEAIVDVPNSDQEHY